MDNAEKKRKQVIDDILQDVAAELTAEYLGWVTGLSEQTAIIDKLYLSFVNDLRHSNIGDEINGPDDVKVFKRATRIYSGVLLGYSYQSELMAEKEGYKNGVEYFLDLYRNMKKSYRDDRKTNST